MSAYRDSELSCPACKGALRAFHDRQCCDACGGIQVGASDLKRSVEDLAGAACTLDWDGGASGRPCPQCGVAMTRATLAIRYDDVVLHSKRGYERCVEHGAWFDDRELAQVFLLVERQVNKGDAMSNRYLPRDTNLDRLTADQYPGAWPLRRK